MQVGEYDAELDEQCTHVHTRIHTHKINAYMQVEGYDAELDERCIHIHTHTQIRNQCMHASGGLQCGAHWKVHTCTHTHTRTHAHTRTLTHTRTHTHTHTYVGLAQIVHGISISFIYAVYNCICAVILYTPYREQGNLESLKINPKRVILQLLKS